MSLKKTWKIKNTWSSVAYEMFRDSREWRYLLKLNPSFDIRFKPAPGTPYLRRWGSWWRHESAQRFW